MLNTIPSNLTPLRDERYLIELMQHGLIHYPAIISLIVGIVSPSVHILVIITVNVLDTIPLVIDALYEPISVLVIVGAYHISLIEGEYPALYVPEAVKVVEETRITIGQLLVHKPLLHSILVSRLPILLEESEVLLVLLGWLTRNKGKLHGVTREMEQLLVLDYLLKRDGHPREMHLTIVPIIYLYT